MDNRGPMREQLTGAWLAPHHGIPGTEHHRGADATRILQAGRARINAAVAPRFFEGAAPASLDTISAGNRPHAPRKAAA